jgi:glycine dehydrogenase subunit 1
MRFIPNNARIRREMLAELGVGSADELFAAIPPELRLARDLAIPPGMAEPDQLALFEGLAQRNAGSGMRAFLGGGSYAHFIPLVVDSLIQRAEFFTSYTPYQPEVSQGTLQAIFEFQTFITTLTGMEVANASVYDGASATAEAVLMAQRLQRGRERVLLAETLHPFYRQVVQTYARRLGLKLEPLPCDAATGRLDLAALEARLGADVACVVLQQPNFFGVVEDVAALAAGTARAGALTVVAVTEALSLALLRPPGASGADLVVGEAQSFGVPVSYGGPYLGFMAARDVHKRQLPGRIAGETLDLEGRRGYVLTLATREQHIRREKATSNICTNQNLVMTMALVYLTLMGREGLREAARQNVALLAYFLDRVRAETPLRPRFSGPRFNEVALACPLPAADVVAGCAERGILAGIDLGRFDPARRNDLLVAVTEVHDRAAIDALVAALKEAAR